jgi:hypothetical protein
MLDTGEHPRHSANPLETGAVDPYALTPKQPYGSVQDVAPTAPPPVSIAEVSDAARAANPSSWVPDVARKTTASGLPRRDSTIDRFDRNRIESGPTIDATPKPSDGYQSKAAGRTGREQIVGSAEPTSQLGTAASRHLLAALIDRIPPSGFGLKLTSPAPKAQSTETVVSAQSPTPHVNPEAGPSAEAANAPDLEEIREAATRIARLRQGAGAASLVGARRAVNEAHVIRTISASPTTTVRGVAKVVPARVRATASVPAVNRVEAIEPRISKATAPHRAVGIASVRRSSHPASHQAGSRPSTAQSIHEIQARLGSNTGPGRDVPRHRARPSLREHLRSLKNKLLG